MKVSAHLAAWVERLASLELPDLPVEEAARLAHARALFIAAGLERVEALAEPDHWLQAELGFADDEQRQRFFAAAPLAALEALRRAAHVHDYAYMNKPPGLRLRLQGPPGEPALARRLEALLAGWQADGLLAEWRWGLYESEAFQFGGEAGLAIAHRHFTDDSRLAAGLLAGHDRDAVLSVTLLVCHDLVRRVVPDTWEQWDVWCRLRELGRALASETARDELLRDNQELLHALVHDGDALLESLSDDEQSLVGEYRAANQRTAARLAQAAREQRLVYGVRQILPFLLAFHWNRLRLDRAEQSLLTEVMVHLLSPKRREDGP